MTDTIGVLQEAPVGSDVSVTYRSPMGQGSKTKTGTKTTDGTPGKVAAIDTGDEYHDGTPKIVTVTTGGTVKVQGRKQAQRIGMLTDVEINGQADA